MKALRALLLAAAAAIAASLSYTAPARAAERVVSLTLPAAPLAPAAGALTLPASASISPAPQLPSLPAGPAAAEVRRTAGIAGPAFARAASPSPAAAVSPRTAPPGASRASAALAAIEGFAAKAPPASASLEDAAGFTGALAGLITGETGRGPPSGAAAAAQAQPETGVVRVADLDGALSALRAASFPRHEDTDALVERLAKEHPELPLTPELVFLVKDRKALAAYGIPEVAAGAARIVSDGRSERKVVILAAPRGVGLDDFVEYSIHEAVHLRDDAVLRIPHERFVEHWLAEGWTQLRSHEMANRSLKSLGRPQRPNAAYSAEVALVKAFIARHGEAPLAELVERGSDAGLRRALGERWDGLLALAAEDPGKAVRQRPYFLELIQVVVEHPEFGPLDFRNASRAMYGTRPS